MNKNEGKAGVVVLIIVLLLLFALAGAYGFLYVTKLENRIIVVESERKNQTNSLNNLQPTNSSLIVQEVNNTSKTFTIEEIKKCIQNYLDLVGRNEGSSEGLLVYLNLTTYQEEKEHTDDNYAKTSIQYSDFKNKMLNYMTEEWFEENFMKTFTERYKDVDGYLWYLDVGASGIEWEVESVTLKGDYSDNSYIAKAYNVHFDDTKELENIEFHIANSNGKCVISYCD